ncbi:MULTISPECIES: DUF1697 domain-containing protein [Methylomonas]|uniref:DUF1697 domain-containing protein n=2 Tax=Methylomonas TaxID=416 RepID=A0A140E5T8_9GAMM|nr:MULTISPECIES: DUF1697 domain-containing protein [Methylomonas]AMK78762.1 hypothetical protein JT25_020095 [Methylomonas denitrificans]OAI08413.1 hypothetical protein A1342_11060 [Methylomonas methanica]TCV83482.1 uncharacterized protein (DUF1697 family) [Methylomonas methanica]
MKTYIALFRGINVGGKHILPMPALVAIFESLGLGDVKTYIQSGNAVFRCQAENVGSLSARIVAEINKRHGFEPQLLLLELAELEKVVLANPFPDAEAQPNTLHLNFLLFAPVNPNLPALDAIKKDSERFSLIDQVFYLHAPEGIGRSKLAAQAEKRLGVAMTSRNWRTVCKLMEFAKKMRLPNTANQ